MMQTNALNGLSAHVYFHLILIVNHLRIFGNYGYSKVEPPARDVTTD